MCSRPPMAEGLPIRKVIGRITSGPLLGGDSPDSICLNKSRSKGPAGARRAMREEAR